MKCTNIFEVPEMAERTVPEKKVPPALSKKTEASLPKGTCHHYYHCKKGCLLFRVILSESQFKMIFHCILCYQKCGRNMPNMNCCAGV